MADDQNDPTIDVARHLYKKHKENDAAADATDDDSAPASQTPTDDAPSDDTARPSWMP